jgi:thioredoxin 1
MTILIEAFSAPGCAKCEQARQALKSVAEEVIGQRLVWRDVNVLEEIDHAVELGVMTPPSLAIDGQLVFPALPTPARLRAELVRRLERAASRTAS